MSDLQPTMYLLPLYDRKNTKKIIIIRHKTEVFKT